MSALFILLTLLAAGLIQALLPDWNLPVPVKLPLLLAATVYFALHTGRSRALYAAVLAGFIHDTFCPVPFGISIPFFLILTLNVILVRQDVFADRLLTYVIFGAMGALLQTVYFGTVLGVTGLRPVYAGALAGRMLGSLIAGALTGPLVYLLISQVHRRKFPARGGADG